MPGQGPRLVFSSMSGSLAGEIERDFAAAGHIVVSNSGHYRMAPDVPLLVPEINPGHLGLLPVQRRERGWSGAIVTNPNCAAVVLVMPLAALKPFGIRRSMVTTFQAVSGAGYPGVPSLDILGNVIPYIGGDEEKKVETETQKILGDLEGDAIRPLPFTVSATCNRVPYDRRPPGDGERRVREPARRARSCWPPWPPSPACPRSASLPSAPKPADPPHGRAGPAADRARTPAWSAAWRTVRRAGSGSAPVFH